MQAAEGPLDAADVSGDVQKGAQDPEKREVTAPYDFVRLAMRKLSHSRCDREVWRSGLKSRHCTAVNRVDQRMCRPRQMPHRGIP